MSKITKAALVALKAAGLVLLILFFVGLWGMGGSHTYHQQSLVYLDSAKQVLIAHGVCQNPDDCTRRNVLFGEGGAVKVGPFEYGGVQIQDYEVSNPNVVGDLVKAFGEVYKQQRGPRLRLDVYETKHLESKTRFAKVLIE